MTTLGAPLFCTGVRLAEDGEILVSGPTVAPGAGPVLATGDLGAWNADGILHVVGRKSDTIVTGGENVAPTEVEAVLEGHPAVAEAAVHGVPSREWGEAVVATVVVRADVSRGGSARPLRGAPGVVQGAQGDPLRRRAAAHAVGEARARAALIRAPARPRW